MRKKVIPTNKELILDDNNIFISKTDYRGRITYVNDYFCEITGYSRDELIGANHNIVRHPDMPRAIFYFMWQTLHQNRNLKAIVKNMTKNGDHYWVITDFKIDRNELGKPTYLAKRRKAPIKLVEHFLPIYEQMIEIENNAIDKDIGMKESLEYFINILNEADKDYDTYVDDVIKESFFGSIFSKLKSLF